MLEVQLMEHTQCLVLSGSRITSKKAINDTFLCYPVIPVIIRCEMLDQKVLTVLPESLDLQVYMFIYMIYEIDFSWFNFADIIDSGH